MLFLYRFGQYERISLKAYKVSYCDSINFAVKQFHHSQGYFTVNSCDELPITLIDYFVGMGLQWVHYVY